MANLSSSVIRTVTSSINYDGLETSGSPPQAHAEHLLSTCPAGVEGYHFLPLGHSRDSCGSPPPNAAGTPSPGDRALTRTSLSQVYPPLSPSRGQVPWCSPQVPPPLSPQARPSGLWNERYAVKQDRPTLSLARGGCGAKQAGWGLGPDLPSLGMS